MNARWRFLIVFLAGLITFLYLLPTLVERPGETLPSFLPQKPLNKGLDLQGGLQLELKVETEKAVENRLNNLAEEITRQLRDERIRVNGTEIRGRDVIFSVRGEDGANRLAKLVDDSYKIFTVTGRDSAGESTTVKLSLLEDEAKVIEQYAIDQGIEKIRSRIDQFGVAEPVIVSQGKGEILVQLPGLGSLSADKVSKEISRIASERSIFGVNVEPLGSEIKVTGADRVALENLADSVTKQFVGLSKDKVETLPDGKYEIILGLASSQRAKKLIGQTAHLEFKLLNDSIPVSEALSRGVPPDSEIIYGKAPTDPKTGRALGERPAYLVKKRAVLTGDSIKEARMSLDQQRAEYYVLMEFDSHGAKVFGDVTTESVGKNLAIILDGVLQSAPVIREPITGGSASITGSFTREQSRDLAIALRSGSLPAPVSVLHEVEVGASLGQDSVDAGIWCMIVGYLAVAGFMAFYYKLSGLLADWALFVNVIMLLGILAMFNATLTLPGIAGIVLTMGIAVDANVLIFERIREELRLGKTPMNAISSGYDKAFATIFDSHVTTLISAVVLGYLGTGPIRGFAITLGIGIVVSLFTSIVGTRSVYELLAEKRGFKRISI